MLAKGAHHTTTEDKRCEYRQKADKFRQCLQQLDITCAANTQNMDKDAASNRDGALDIFRGH